MRLPDFFIIGAAKAGTTSIHAVLSQHPQVFMPENKETEFFARDDKYAAGLASYAKNFEEAGAQQIVGEASTIYSLAPFFPETAARIASVRPDAKIVYILREPVARAYSYYLQLIKSYQRSTHDTKLHRTFEDFVLPERHAVAASRELCFSRANAHLPDDPELCLAGSDYLMQIERYRAHFDRSQMLFLLFEDLSFDPERFYRKLTDFLGIEPLEPGIFQDTSLLRNVSRDDFKGIAMNKAIITMRDRTGLLWPLRKIFPKRLRNQAQGWLRTIAAEGHEVSPPSMLPNTQARLDARFRAQRVSLSDFTGLDLSIWDAAVQLNHAVK